MGMRHTVSSLPLNGRTRRPDAWSPPSRPWGVTAPPRALLLGRDRGGMTSPRPSRSHTTVPTPPLRPLGLTQHLRQVQAPRGARQVDRHLPRGPVRPRAPRVGPVPHLPHTSGGPGRRPPAQSPERRPSKAEVGRCPRRTDTCEVCCWPVTAQRARACGPHRGRPSRQEGVGPSAPQPELRGRLAPRLCHVTGAQHTAVQDSNSGPGAQPPPGSPA